MILIKNCAILPMTGPHDFMEQGYIVIKDEKIKDMGRGQPPGEAAFNEVIDAQGMLAMPGMINTHTHIAMTLLRGYADDLPLMEWLTTKIWPLEDKLQPEDVYWGTMLGIVEMIKSGTTCFADMYFFMDEVAKAVEESGMRACLSRGMIGLGPQAETAFEESRQLVEKWHGKAQGRIRIMLGPHAPYTCPFDYLKKVANLAEELGVGIHIHLAETKTEVANIKEQYGKSPIELVEEAGILGSRVLAAHCVHLTEEDMEILARYQVGVAHNPQSNMKLASGVAPVPAMLNHGITVALGTDGAASNNNLDMIDEMRTCALLHKVSSLDPTVLNAYQVLRMATVNGASVLGWTDIGMLGPGMKADLILIDLNKPHLCPRFDVGAHLVYAAQGADVDTVIINGRVVMQGRKLLFLDEEEIMRRVQERVLHLVSP